MLHEQSDWIPRVQRREGRTQFRQRPNLVSVEFVDDVTRGEARIEGGEFRGYGGNDNAIKPARLGEIRRDFFVESNGQDSEFADQVGLVIHEVGEHERGVRPLKNRHEYFHRRTISQNVERQLISDGGFEDFRLDLACQGDRMAAGRQHDIALFEASCVSRPARQHVRKDHTGMAIEPQGLRHQRIDILSDYANGSPMHVAFFADLLIDTPHNVGRDGKTDSLAAAGSGVNHGVDARDIAIRVQQRPAAIAGVDGRVGLNISSRLTGIQLARGRADETHGESIFEAERTAEREDDLPLFEGVGIAKMEGWEIGSVDLQDGEIRIFIRAYDAGGVMPMGIFMCGI